MFKRLLLVLPLGLLVASAPPAVGTAQEDATDEEASESATTSNADDESADSRTGEAPDIESDGEEDESDEADTSEEPSADGDDATGGETKTDSDDQNEQGSGETSSGEETDGAADTDEVSRDGEANGRASQPTSGNDDGDDPSEASEPGEEADSEEREDDEDETEEDDEERAESDDEESDDEEDDAEDESAGSIAVQTDVSERDVYIEGNRGDDAPGWRLGIGGYVRAGYTSIQNDPTVEFVGRNDGFRLADARLSLNGELQNGIGFMFEFDGAVERREETDPNSPVVPVDMRLTDTFIYYQPFDFLRVAVGQFKPPFDVEEQFSNSDLLFVQESVGSTGVSGVAGYNVDGLSRTREVGLRVDGEPWYPTADDGEHEGFGVSAAAAATNGQTANQNMNDNDRLAYYGRLGLHWGEYVRLGGAYFHNDGTTGERPDLVDVVESGWTTDLTVEAKGVTAVGGFTQTSETLFAGTSDTRETLQSTAYHGEIAYEEPFIGLQPAYRYAFYDPTSSVDGDPQGAFYQSDARTHHTIGLNYNAKKYPIRLLANYTITVEQSQRELQNNRFDAILQLAW